MIPRNFSDTLPLRDEMFSALLETGNVVFEPVDGEEIQVKHWFRYPNYDFIVGVPAPESPRKEKECAAMCVRYKDGRSYCTYFDKQELGDMVGALLMVYTEEKQKGGYAPSTF